MSKILQVENLVQEFNLTKDFLDKVKFKNGHFSLENRVVHAVNNVSFDVEQGEVFSLVGESGCGKTTFLRCIGGFETFDGTVKVNGKEVSEPGTDRIMVFQDFNQLLPWKTFVSS